MPLTRRRLPALILLAAAPAPVAVAVWAAAGSDLYVHVHLAQPYLAVVLGAVFLGAAGWLGLNGRRWRIGAQWLAAALATVVLLAGCVAGMEDPFTPTRGPVVASSAGHQLVGYEVMGAVAALRVRTREGLLSRESRRDLACFSGSSSSAAPEALFDRVSFVTEDEVEVVTADGRATRVRFDPRTLAPRTAPEGCG